MASFLKYQSSSNVTDGNGRGPLSFARAHHDGMPYRGSPAMLREEEFEEYTETVRDGKVDLFDLSDPQQKSHYQEIVDRAANHWYRIVSMSEKWVQKGDGTWTVLVYCTWIEPHKELNRFRLPVGVSGGQPQQLEDSHDYRIH